MIKKVSLCMCLLVPGVMKAMEFVPCSMRLFEAVRKADEAAVTQLISAGVDVNAADPVSQKTALHVAAFRVR